LKLKLLKNYLKSSMPQEILNDIAILCIEKNIIKHINVTQISDFISRNTCRDCFI
jgi:hypothetical protein